MSNDQHQNRDRFADDLDRIVSGQQPEHNDALASFAMDIQMHQGAARLDPDRRAEIRRNLMQNITSTTPTTGGAGPLSQPTIIDPALHNPWVRRKPVDSQTPSGWRGHIVKAQTAIAIVTAFALLIIGIAWYTGQEGGNGPASSSNQIAAAPTEVLYSSQGAGNGSGNVSSSGTGNPLGINETGEVPPTGSPVAVQGAGWTEPIQAEECMPREPRINAERDEILSGTPASPGDAYGPTTTPSVRDAADVAMTLRRYQACLMANVNADGYVSDRFVYENSSLAPNDSPYNDEAQLRAAREVSAAYQDVDPSEFIILVYGPEGTPPTSMTIVASPGVYQPKHARQMADGRIALPSTQLVQEGMFPEGRSAHMGNVFLMTEMDGGWVVDEMLLFCIGDCDDFWSQYAEMVDRMYALATKEAGPEATPAPTPAGTPEARTVEDTEWWTWPSVEECDAEEFTRNETGNVDWPEREYLPLLTPNRADAEAAARLPRAAQACGLPYAVEWILTGRAYEERILEDDLAIIFTKQADDIHHGRALSDAYAIQKPKVFGRLTNEAPIPATPSAMERLTGAPPATNPYEPYSAVFIPAQAVLLPDGRIAVPESLIAWEGEEDLSPRGAPDTWETHVSRILVLSDASGQWLVDEILPFCVGQCDAFWSEQKAIADRLRATATEESNQDATPASTPSAVNIKEDDRIAMLPVDHNIWLACPDSTGPSTLATRSDDAENKDDVIIQRAITPWSGPAVPPTIPCDHPTPEPPPDFVPVPLG